MAAAVAWNSCGAEEWASPAARVLEAALWVFQEPGSGSPEAVAWAALWWELRPGEEPRPEPRPEPPPLPLWMGESPERPRLLLLPGMTVKLWLGGRQNLGPTLRRTGLLSSEGEASALEAL